MAHQPKFGNPEPVASHIPLLVRVFDKSKGDVLEVGTGYYSTLLLHWLANTSRRQLYSYESSDYWYKRATEKMRMENDYHHIVYCPNWDDIPTDKHWGMIFIDHGPNERRIVEIEKFKDKCDYMVIHDTEPASNRAYKYSEIWPLFKYKYDYNKILPATSVVSNFKDLKDIE